MIRSLFLTPRIRNQRDTMTFLKRFQTLMPKRFDVFSIVVFIFLSLYFGY